MTTSCALAGIVSLLFMALAFHDQLQGILKRLAYPA
jgi:hypothetical protein